jgi:hypothetical protein
MFPFIALADQVLETAVHIVKQGDRVQRPALEFGLRDP